MDFSHVEPIVRAVLYEGYILYPYRASSIKNQYRWTFGGLYPKTWCDSHTDDAWRSTTETVLVGTERSPVAVSVRFLQLVDRPATATRPAWQEAVERRVDLPSRAAGEYLARAHQRVFAFDACAAGGSAVRGEVQVSAVRAHGGTLRLSVTVSNRTDVTDPAVSDRSRVLLESLASVHVLLGALDGEFASLTDPPPELHEAVDGCKNVGMWPVLAGSAGGRDTVLASPIILGDHPRVAEESPGDLFDGTEIDEILTLRILTLTDAEKAEMRAVDPRACVLLDRVEALGPEALLAMHGTFREPDAALRRGSRVRLRPRARADIFDIALAGREATVASVERDFDGRVFVAVTIDDDPGRDLGLTGQPGHRFFFRADEVELLA